MSTTIDQQFVEFIVKSLVGKPDAVQIERRIDEKGVLLELTVDPEDLGRVIGKRGATAQSLRTLLRALGTKNEARYNLKIIDNGEPRPPREDNRSGEGRQDEAPASDTTDDSSATSTSQADEPVKDTSSSWGSSTRADDDELPTDTTSDRGSIADRTRKELEDLDDLDV